MKPHYGAVSVAIMALATVCAGADGEQRSRRCVMMFLRSVDFLDVTLVIVILKIFV